MSRTRVSLRMQALQGLDPATAVPPVAVATGKKRKAATVAAPADVSNPAFNTVGVVAPRKRLKDNATGTNSAFNLSIVLVEFSSDALR